MRIGKQARLAYTARAKDLVSQMSLEEKVYLMSGSISLPDLIASMTQEGGHYNAIPYPAGGNTRLGIAPVAFCDGPRGVVSGTGKSTCFPVSMCRGATFDTALEEEIGRAIGREIRGFGGNFFGGVCINLPYNPGWGRSQEVYGEDSFALGQMGSALVRGVQDESVMACAKHYAFNSMEISRFKASIDCERRTEREVYLAHFKDVIDAGAASVMSAYNKYKGVHCGHSDYLLRKVLKEEWDFDGFVMSDFVWGIRDTVEAANGGQDIEMCNTQHFGEKLVQAVRDGLVSEVRIDEAAVRIVRTVLAFEEDYARRGVHYGDEVIGCDAHIALALRAAREGITLLKNEGAVLPFDKTATKKLAVIGKLANEKVIGDHGSSRVFPAYVVTALEGLTKAFGESEILYEDGSDVEAAKRAARAADAVVFIVGYNHDDEGEYISGEQSSNYTGSAGGDRKDGLGLHADEVNLIKAVAPENRNAACVMIGGNTILISEWEAAVPAILMAYYPGQEGGVAIAEILTGEVNPSGKLRFVLPASEADLPAVKWDTTNEYYEYYHGYARLDKNGVAPLRPYGFGLSYTTFAYSNAAFSVDPDQLTATVTVKNTGDRPGDEVVQMYVGFANSALDRPKKALRGFARVHLAPGEEKKVEIACPVQRLAYYDEKAGRFTVENMAHEVYIGASEADADLLSGTVFVGTARS